MGELSCEDHVECRRRHLWGRPGSEWGERGLSTVLHVIIGFFLLLVKDVMGQAAAVVVSLLGWPESQNKAFLP